MAVCALALLLLRRCLNGWPWQILTQHADEPGAELVAVALTGVGGWTPLDASEVEFEVHHKPKNWRTPPNYRCAGCGERRLGVRIFLCTGMAEGTARISRLHIRNFPSLRSLTITGFKKGFRFCYYTGKFFCRSCHDDDMAVVPARILVNWDFGIRPVSKFARSGK
jgi:hypothetical protein